MRRAEISEKFSVTLWACLHNGNPAKQQLDELSAPAGQNKKVYAQKNNLLTTFSSGLGLSPRCLRQLHTPEGKKKGTCINRYLIGCVRSPAIFHKSRGAAPFFFKPSGYTSWLSLRSAEEPFHRAWGFRPVAFGNSIPRRQKRKVPA